MRSLTLKANEERARTCQFEVVVPSQLTPGCQFREPGHDRLRASADWPLSFPTSFARSPTQWRVQLHCISVGRIGTMPSSLRTSSSGRSKCSSSQTGGRNLAFEPTRYPSITI